MPGVRTERQPPTSALERNARPPRLGAPGTRATCWAARRSVAAGRPWDPNRLA